MKPATIVKASILMGLAVFSALPVAEVLAPNTAFAQNDVRQEDRRADRQQDRQSDRREDRQNDRREDRQQDRQQDRREDRRADRGGRGR